MGRKCSIPYDARTTCRRGGRPLPLPSPHLALGSRCFRLTGSRPGTLYDGSATLCPVLGTDHSCLLLLHSLLVQMTPRAAIYRHHDLSESKRPHFLTYGQEEDYTPISCPLTMAEPGGFIYTKHWMDNWLGSQFSRNALRGKNTLWNSIFNML